MRRRSALWFVSFLLFSSPLETLGGNEDGIPADDSQEEILKEDTQNSSGGFLGSLFGDSSDIGKDGKLIDALDETSFHVAHSTPGAPVGKDLARREAFGPGNIPLPFPEAHAYTVEIINRLANAVNFSEFIPKVEIVSNDLIWASAYPDGTVLVSLGALRNLQSEDEFAAILAHELSHILLNHHSSDWFMETQQRGLAIFNLVLDVKTALEKTQGETATQNEWDKYKNRLIAETIVLGSELFLSAPFNRDQEDESDLLGTDILIKAGYTPYGMPLLLERLVAQEAKNAAEKQARKEKRKAAEGPQSGGFFAELVGLFAGIGSNIKDDLRAEFGTDHRKAEDRRAFVSRYLGKYYADLPLRAHSKKRWAALIKDAPKVDLVLEGYRNALMARNNLTDGDLPGSISNIRRSLGSLGGNGHAMPYSVAAEINATRGDYIAAADFYRKALTQYLPTTGVYLGLSEALIRAGLPDEAAKVILQGARELKNPPQLLPSKIVISRIDGSKGVGNKFDAVALLAECRLEGLDALKKQCEQAMKGEYTVFGEKLSPKAQREAARLGSIRLKSRKIRISGSQLNARSGPGTNFPTVASYLPTNTLTVIATHGKWLKIRDKNNRTAWVAGWLTKPARQTSRRAKPRTRTPKPLISTIQKRARVGAPMTDIETRLRKLKNLFTKGLITEKDYNKNRQAILDSL